MPHCISYRYCIRLYQYRSTWYVFCELRRYAIASRSYSDSIAPVTRSSATPGTLTGIDRRLLSRLNISCNIFKNTARMNVATRPCSYSSAMWYGRPAPATCFPAGVWYVDSHSLVANANRISVHSWTTDYSEDSGWFDTTWKGCVVGQWYAVPVTLATLIVKKIRSNKWRRRRRLASLERMTVIHMEEKPVTEGFGSKTPAKAPAFGVLHVGS